MRCVLSSLKLAMRSQCWVSRASFAHTLDSEIYEKATRCELQPLVAFTVIDLLETVEDGAAKVPLRLGPLTFGSVFTLRSYSFAFA